MGHLHRVQFAVGSRPGVSEWEGGEIRFAEDEMTWETELVEWSSDRHLLRCEEEGE